MKYSFHLLYILQTLATLSIEASTNVDLYSLCSNGQVNHKGVLYSLRPSRIHIYKRNSCLYSENNNVQSSCKQ